MFIISYSFLLIVIRDMFIVFFLFTVLNTLLSNRLQGKNVAETFHNIAYICEGSFREWSRDKTEQQ